MAREKVRPSEVIEVISERKLKQLLKDKATAHKDRGEIGRAISDKIAHAVEHDHLHRKAFNVIEKCWRMEPRELADFKDALDHMWDASGLQERAESAPRLPIDEDNVHNIREAAE